MRAITYLSRILSKGTLSRGTFSTIGLGSHHSVLRASFTGFRSTSINMAAPEYYTFGADRFGVKGDIAIAESLEKLKLKHWGFVVYRCTYGSQEKWDKFIAVVKQEAHSWLERWGTEELAVYDKMELTVIEDAETLDSASILDTTRKFQAYVEEEKRTDKTLQAYDCTPRYHFFVHVDEESLESVVDNEKARERIGYFFKVVNTSSVMIREAARLTGEIEPGYGPEDELDDSLDCEKKFRLKDFVQLYIDLLRSQDTWFDIYVDMDYDNMRAGLSTL